MTIRVLFVGLPVLVIAALVAVYFYTSTESDLDSGNKSLKARTCEFHYFSYLDISCFYYETKAMNDDPKLSGVAYHLPMVLLSPKAKDVNDQPTKENRNLVIYIPGGPGQGGMVREPVVNEWADWMEKNRIRFDLLLYDPRGTKGSIPSLDCPAYQKMMRELLASDVSAEQESKMLNNTLSRCFSMASDILSPEKNETEKIEDERAKNSKTSTEEERVQAGALNSLATLNQANDIEGMINALGYQQAVLWGVSYGSRLALAAAKFQKVKALILESPYPFSKGVYSEWVRLYAESFDRHELLYKEFGKGQHADYRSLYDAALSELNSTSVSAVADIWHDDSRLHFILNAFRLLEVSFSVLYSPHLYESYYQGLEQFIQNKRMNEQFLSVLEEHFNYALANDFSVIVYFATECLDNQGQSADVLEESVKNLPYYETYFRSGFEDSACSVYPFGDDYYLQNVEYSDKNTLIVIGEFDPVTPREWGYELETKLSDAKVIEILGGGHASAKQSTCDWEALNDFVSKAAGEVASNKENLASSVNFSCHL